MMIPIARAAGPPIGAAADMLPAGILAERGIEGLMRNEFDRGRWKRRRRNASDPTVGRASRRRRLATVTHRNEVALRGVFNVRTSSRDFFEDDD